MKLIVFITICKKKPQNEVSQASWSLEAKLIMSRQEHGNTCPSRWYMSTD